MALVHCTYMLIALEIYTGFIKSEKESSTFNSKEAVFTFTIFQLSSFRKVKEQNKDNKG